MTTINPFAAADVTFAANPPADPLRKAAKSIAFATTLPPAQIAWARSHDWFDSATADGALIVIDRFSFEGRSYEERIVWGGTFSELAAWAGY